MGPLRLPAADPEEAGGLGAPVSSALISTVKPVPHFLQVVRLPRFSSRTVYFCPDTEIRELQSLLGAYPFSPRTPSPPE